MLDTAPYATEAEVESASLKLLVRERGRCPSAIDYKVYTYGSGFVQTGWIDYIPSQAEIHVRAETKINTPDVPIWVWSHVQDSNLKAVVAQFGSLQDLKRYGCKRIKVNEEEETKESLKVIREFDRE